MPRGEVEVTILQRAFDASGLTLSDLARRLGWTEPYPGRKTHLIRGETSRVQRAMGRMTDPPKRGREPMARRHVTYDLAVRFVQACGFDPVDFDL